VSLRRPGNNPHSVLVFHSHALLPNQHTRNIMYALQPNKVIRHLSEVNGHIFRRCMVKLNVHYVDIHLSILLFLIIIITTTTTPIIIIIIVHLPPCTRSTAGSSA
jgi:hypothetical protein